MRTFYDELVARKELPSNSDRAIRIFMLVALYGFWGPSLLVDAALLWRNWGSDGGGAFVFWLLFRQAMVFLALWFTVAVAHGLLVGRRTPPEPKPKRPRLPAAARGYSRR